MSYIETDVDFCEENARSQKLPEMYRRQNGERRREFLSQAAIALAATGRFTAPEAVDRAELLLFEMKKRGYLP